MHLIHTFTLLCKFGDTHYINRYILLWKARKHAAQYMNIGHREVHLKGVAQWYTRLQTSHIPVAHRQKYVVKRLQTGKYSRRTRRSP